MEKNFFVLICAVSLMIFNLGCGNRVASVPSHEETVEIEIIDFILEDVSVSVSTTIVWTNMDYKAHTVTSGISPKKDGTWDSPFIEQGDTFKIQFKETGSFPYWCRVHPFMVGTIIVED